MYSITKGELIFILDTVEEIINICDGEWGVDELREVAVIINGILDNGDQDD